MVRIHQKSVMLAHENPFRMQRVEDVLIFEPEWIGERWEDFLARVGQAKWRGQIVGPRGSGKSACLRRLQSEFGHRFVLFNEDRHRPNKDRLRGIVSETTSKDTLLIDGAEQLGFLQARWFFRKLRHAKGVLLTTHKPMRRWPVLLKTATTPAMLQEMTEILAPQWSEVFTQGYCEELYQRHHGNLREALWECYDRCADQKESPW